MSSGPILKVLLPLAAALLLLGTACGGGDVEPIATPAPIPHLDPEATPTPAPDPSEQDGDTLALNTPAAARAALGRVVRVVGTARNAKLSAVLAAGDLHVYCLDRPDGWSGELLRGRLTVTGTIEFTEEFAATTDPDGAVSAGTDGGVFVMRDCQVEVPAP